MSKRTITQLLATAAAAAMLAVAWGVATASSSSAATSATKTRVVTIAMADPGCHWFRVAGKNKARLTVDGKTTFRNLDEAALVFRGTNFRQRVGVDKTITIAKQGTYRIKMVQQHPDDNVLVLVVK
jgi:hypothetical protein